MAARPVWRGHLRLALVSCPVAMYPSLQAASSLHFHFINPETGHRVRMITQDAETGDEVRRGELSRGYEFKKDHYLILNEEDFERARIPSSTTLTIDKFVDAASIDPLYYDAGYYLAPDGDGASDVYVVLRDAVAQAGKVALSRVVIARRERAVAIRPMGRGLAIHTLHEERDLADAAGLFQSVPTAAPDPEMVELAAQLIGRQAGRYDPADAEDRYETRLRAVIDAKLQGEGLAPDAEPEPDRTNVVDLMDALKRSLGQDAPAKGEGRAAAKGPAAAKKAAAAKPGSRRRG